MGLAVVKYNSLLIPAPMESAFLLISKVLSRYRLINTKWTKYLFKWMHSHCYVLDAIYYLPRLQVTNLQFFSEFFQTSSVSFQTVHLQPLFRYSSFLTWLLHGRLTFPELAPYVSSFSSCSTEIYKNMAVSLPNLFLLAPFFFQEENL